MKKKRKRTDVQPELKFINLKQKNYFQPYLTLFFQSWIYGKRIFFLMTEYPFHFIVIKYVERPMMRILF